MVLKKENARLPQQLQTGTGRWISSGSEPSRVTIPQGGKLDYGRLAQSLIPSSSSKPCNIAKLRGSLPLQLLCSFDTCSWTLDLLLDWSRTTSSVSEFFVDSAVNLDDCVGRIAVSIVQALNSYCFSMIVIFTPWDLLPLKTPKLKLFPVFFSSKRFHLVFVVSAWCFFYFINISVLTFCCFVFRKL